MSAQGARLDAGASRVVWVRDGGGFIAGVLAWVLIVLMIVPDGLDYASLADTTVPAAGSPISRALWLALLGVGAAIVLLRGMMGALLLRWVNPFLIAFAALALASLIWSVEPSVTARRLIRVAAVLVVGLALVLSGWHPRRFQNVVRPALTCVLLGSLVFGLVNPQLAIHQQTSAELLDAWHGLANHKNTLGALSCLGVLFWFHAWLSREVGPWRALAGLLVAGSCLLLSRSATSLVTTIFVAGFLLLMQKPPAGLRPYMPYFVAAFVALLVLYALAVLRLIPGANVLLQPIVAVTGKDLSFTGRTEIWEIIREHMRLAPLLGNGLGAYWVGPYPHSASFEFVLRMHFYPGSAHNGYLEIANDLGLVGLLCLAGYLAHFVFQGLRLWQLAPAQGSLFLGLFLQQAISNLSESHWLSVLSVSFVIMTFAATGLARLLLEHRMRAYFGAPPAAARARPPHMPSPVVPEHSRAPG